MRYQSLTAARRLAFLAALGGGTALASSAVGGCSGPDSRQARPAQPKSQRLSWPSAQPLSYRLQLRSASTALGAPNDVRFSMKGRLDVVARRHGEETELALRVVDAAFDSDGKAVDQYASLAGELSHAYLVTQRNGVTSAEHLPPNTSTFAATLLRSLGSALQMGAGNVDANGSWKTREVDGSGHYEIEYLPVGPHESGSFERKKLAYEPSPVPNPNPLLGKQMLAPRVAASTGKLRLGHGGVLEELLINDELSLPLLKGVVSGRTELTLTRQPQPAAWALDWHATRAESVPAAPGVPLGQGAAPELVDTHRIGDYTFESALKELREGAAERERANKGEVPRAASGLRTRAFSAMVAMARVRPETPRKIAAVIKTADPVASTLADALASAGSPAAQDTLIELLGSGPASKRHAASSLVRVDNPTEAAERAVRGLCDDPSYLEFCLYGMGSYARKLRASGQRGRSDALGRTLTERLLASKPGVDQQIALRGIANSGDRAAFAVVAPLLSNQSPSVRSAAVDAIRLMPGADVETALVDRLEHDPSTGVRLGVVGAALARPRSDALTAAVERAATQDTNSGVRSQSVRALIKWLPETPRLRSVLANVAASDGNKAVKAAAADALTQLTSAAISQ